MGSALTVNILLNGTRIGSLSVRPSESLGALLNRVVDGPNGRGIKIIHVDRDADANGEATAYATEDLST